MDLFLYRDINKFCDFFYNNEKIDIILNNIDSLKISFIDAFSISKCKKVFSSLVKDQDSEASKNLKAPELKGFVFDFISVMIDLYKMHPIVKSLIVYFYMVKYKCYDTQSLKIFIKLSLRLYMGFFLKQNKINKLFHLECTQLNTFVLSGLFVLNDATNISRKYLIEYFYQNHFNYKCLKKEYSETQSVFNQVNFKNKTTVNICAGNACGIHLLDTKITCIDLNQYYGMMLLEKMNTCNFIKCNIMDNTFETIVALFEVWIAIHACRDLSVRIMKVFQNHASMYSELYLVPCCTFSRQYYRQNLDDFLYNRLYKIYYTSKSNLREYFNPAMHFELLCSLCMMYKFKIKTLNDMLSIKNKIIIVYK